MSSSKTCNKSVNFFFFSLPSIFFRPPELPALMKIRKAPGMPGEPGVIAHGRVVGEPPIH